jgi:ABC-type transporter Mla subunit MlaD
MQYKFNPYERAVGLFVTFAIVGSVAIGATLAIKKNWFEDKVTYTTYTESAANLRVGGNVLMSGLQVGRVESIDLHQTQHIKVTFSVLREYSNLMTDGTLVHFIRPFIIGDKALSLIQGPHNAKLLVMGAELPEQVTLDVLDVLSGQKLEGIIGKVDNILNNLNQTMSIGKDIALQVGDKKKLKKTLDDLNFIMGDVRKVTYHLSANVPQATEHMGKIIDNLAIITSAFKELQPEGAKTIELLHESVITLKAMQKSMLLRGGVEEVKEEMALKEKQKLEGRAPASEK